MAKVSPKTESDVDIEVETRVDEGLAKLYETWQRREAQNNQQFVAICEYVRDNKLKRSIVKKTLESRGLTPSSVSSELSRLMSLSKPENREILEKLAGEEITVAAARKAIAKPQAHPKLDAVTKVWGMLYRAAESAVKSSRNDPTFTLKFFTQEAANAWTQAMDKLEEKEREAQEEPEGGEEEEAELVES